MLFVLFCAVYEVSIVHANESNTSHVYCIGHDKESCYNQCKNQNYYSNIIITLLYLVIL